MLKTIGDRFVCFGFMLVLCTFGLPALAQDSTAEALNAKRVKDFIRLQSLGSGDGFRLEYQRDDKTGDSFKPLRSRGFGTSFLSSDGMQLRFKSFNPLKYSLAVKVEELDDENFKALERIVDALLNLGRSLGGVNDAGAAITETKIARTRAAPAVDEEIISECLQVAKLLDTLKTLHTILTKDLVKQREIKRWTDSATGYVGIHEVRGDVNVEIEKTKAAIKKAGDTLKSIIDVDSSRHARKAAAARSPPAIAECDDAIAEAIQLSMAISFKYEDSIRGMNSLLDSLIRLEAVLKRYDFDDENQAKEKWARDENDEPMDYIFMRYDPKEGKRSKVDLILIRRSVALQDDKIEFKDKDAVSASLSVRKYSAMVAEIGAGLLWSNLKIPRYGTEEVGGQTQLVLAREERLGAQATVVGNFVFRTGGGSFVHPGFQVGVGTGEETPALLYGLVLRFTAPKHVSVSFGGVTTWTRQLDKLRVGDTIGGTAELEADLQSKSESDSYVAIQYNWSSGKQ